VLDMALTKHHIGSQDGFRSDPSFQPKLQLQVI
jgi:hypothetical protein